MLTEQLEQKWGSTIRVASPSIHARLDDIIGEINDKASAALTRMLSPVKFELEQRESDPGSSYTFMIPVKGAQEEYFLELSVVLGFDGWLNCELAEVEGEDYTGKVLLKSQLFSVDDFLGATTESLGAKIAAAFRVPCISSLGAHGF